MRIIWLMTLMCLPALSLSACKSVSQNNSSSGLYQDSDPSIYDAPSRSYSRPTVGSPRSSLASRTSENLNISSISMEDVFKLQQADRAVIIDARHPYYYGLGHIPSAINIPSEECEPIIRKMDDDFKEAIKENKVIIVYCSGVLCKDARIVARHIARNGHLVHKFYGGWGAWQDAGLPAEFESQ